MKQTSQQVSVPALRRAMRNTEQTKGMSVLAHGISVARYFDDLYQHRVHAKPLRYDWKLPEWTESKVLWDSLLPLPILRTYQLYHDVGKPFCRTVDEDGRVHFPDHATKSHDIWLQTTADQQVATLMKMDMDIHLLKAEGVAEFSQRKEAASLLLTGLAEIHSNAAMFGGIESTSFKIKYKQINRRGNAIVKQLQDKGTN